MITSATKHTTRTGADDGSDDMEDADVSIAETNYLSSGGGRVGERTRIDYEAELLMHGMATDSPSSTAADGNLDRDALLSGTTDVMRRRLATEKLRLADASLRMYNCVKHLLLVGPEAARITNQVLH